MTDETKKTTNEHKFSYGDIFYYVTPYDRVDFMSIFEDDTQPTVVLALWLMGNVFKTYKEAESNKKAMMKKYKQIQNEYCKP